MTGTIRTYGPRPPPSMAFPKELNQYSPTFVPSPCFSPVRHCPTHTVTGVREKALFKNRIPACVAYGERERNGARWQQGLTRIPGSCSTRQSRKLSCEQRWEARRGARQSGCCLHDSGQALMANESETEWYGDKREPTRRRSRMGQDTQKPRTE